MGPFVRVADRIKHYRSMRRKTQVNLAKEASIDYRHFQKLEAGQSDFKVSTILKLSEALAIPPCYLLQTDPYEIEGKKSDEMCASQMLGQLTLGVVGWNLNGNIMFCNSKFAGILEMENEIEALRLFNLRELIPKDVSIHQQNYQKSIRERQINSDFIRAQIRTPKSDSLKVVWARWNEVNCGKSGNRKGYVATVWEENDFHDLGVLPATTSRA